MGNANVSAAQQKCGCVKPNEVKDEVAIKPASSLAPGARIDAELGILAADSAPKAGASPGGPAQASLSAAQQEEPEAEAPTPTSAAQKRVDQEREALIAEQAQKEARAKKEAAQAAEAEKAKAVAAAVAAEAAKVAPPPPPPAAASAPGGGAGGAGLTLVFEVPGGALKTVTFQRKPMGFDFHYQAPITVDSVFPGSHAEQLGVKPGWIVRTIQGEDMGGKDFQAKYDKFAQAATSLPGGLEMHFQVPDGSEKVVVLEKRPIGFDFEKRAPILVDTVEAGSHAEQLGVKPGWVIVRINGEDMTGLDFDTKFTHLANGLRLLPGS